MRKPGRKVAILAASLLFVAAFAAWAPSADARTVVYAFYNGATSACLVDNGGSVFEQECPMPATDINHAGLWYIQDTKTIDVSNHAELFQIRNVHDSTQCLASNGTTKIMAACGTNHVQYWEITNVGGGLSTIRNAHFRDLLKANDGSPNWAIVQTFV